MSYFKKIIQSSPDLPTIREIQNLSEDCIDKLPEEIKEITFNF
jgi:hypothetical protein